ncbi:MAG: flagellar export protein FliJ [Rhodoferax sp.]|jgi:flagellar protein FliJ|nr:flagellar export protein FliJ [Rhodoferax sp.]
MTAVNGLLTAIELATRQRDDAGQAMAQVVRRHAQACQQLEQLESYAADTSARWSVTSQSSATPQIVGHYYQFMARLEQTIEMQQGAIAEVQRQRESARQILLDAEVRLAGLARLLEKRRSELARVHSQREQRQSDELASQMHRRRLLANDNRE